MIFQDFALNLNEIEAEPSRLKMTELLAAMWQRLDLAEVPAAANLIQGQLQPAYESLEFNLSEKMVARALVRLILRAGGLPHQGVNVDLFGEADEASVSEQVRKWQRQNGDWGETAAIVIEQLRLPTQALTIETVYARLKAVALEEGTGSQERKLELLAELLALMPAAAAKVIARIVIGKLRLGFSLMTILDSLSWTGTQSKSETKQLEEIYQKKADLGLLAQAYLQKLALPSAERLQELQTEYQLQTGIPVVPALCQRLNSSAEIITKMTQVIAEPKYDGMRVQIHIKRLDDGAIKVHAFSRSLENVSPMFPELQKLAASLDKIDSLILDSEALGYQKDTGQFLPFQEMMTRRRKHDIAAKSQSLPIKFLIFDVLYLNGQELIDQPLTARKKVLAQILPAQIPQAMLAPYIITSDADELRHYHEQQLSLGLEGLVAKSETSPYQSGRKGWQWVKIKEEEGTRGKLKDTLDLVILGLYAGKGKRHGFGAGAFLAGVTNDQGDFLTLSKIGTGLTDDDFRELARRSEKLRTQTPPKNYQVARVLSPDIWLIPELVAEIAADEITRSSVHTSGFGLRFPRLVKWRDDKTAAQATTLTEIQALTQLESNSPNN
jgi:DNA ligase-1